MDGNTSSTRTSNPIKYVKKVLHPGGLLDVNADILTAHNRQYGRVTGANMCRYQRFDDVPFPNG
jgi:hypothetical protein